MLFNHAVLIERLHSLALEGILPDGCLVRESEGYFGHWDFLLQTAGKPVGLVRLACSPAERDEMLNTIQKTFPLFRPQLGGEAAAASTSPSQTPGPTPM